MKNATKVVKKVAKVVKKVAKAVKKVKGLVGRRGRTSAMAGLKITKLVSTEDSGLRSSGKVRECWDVIANGMSVDVYREKCTDSSLARKVLADFIVKKLVKVA